jgi:predicted MFS family arabinose efflux permease
VAIGAVLCALAPTSAAAGPYTLAIGRLATGMGGGAAVLAAFVVVFASVPAGSRPVVSAGVWGAVGGVVLLSALAAPSLARATGGEWRIVFWMTATIAICLAVSIPGGGVTTGQRGQMLTAERGFSARDMLTLRWVFLLLAYFWFGAGYIGFATFLGSRLLDGHGSFGLLSATWSVFGIAIMTGATLTIFVLRAARLARYALAAATAAGLLGAMVTVSGSSWATLAGTFLVGLSVASTPAIITTYVRQRCSAEEYARALGFASAIVGFGQLMGPALTGMLADRIGTQAVPLVAMVLYACAAGCGLLDSRFGTRPAGGFPVSSRPELGRFEATCAS